MLKYVDIVSEGNTSMVVHRNIIGRNWVYFWNMLHTLTFVTATRSFSIRPTLLCTARLEKPLKPLLVCFIFEGRCETCSGMVL